MYVCVCVCVPEGPFSRMNKQAILCQDSLSTTVVLEYNNNNSAIKMNFIFVNKCEMPHLLYDSLELRKTHTTIHKHFILI